MTAQPEVTMRSETKRVLGLARRSVVLSSREVKVLADEIDRLRAQAAALRKVVTGEVNHVYRGLCPDVRLGENVGGVDPDCPACATLGVQS